MTELVASFALGLAGSLHCVAMCGPVVVLIKHRARGLGPSTPGRDLPMAAWLTPCIYQAMRLFTYALLGLASGSIGRLSVLAGVGTWLSLICGAVLIAAAVGVTGISRIIGGRVTSMVVPGLQWAMRRTGDAPRLSAAIAGALNGLLPCGLVYAALAAAMATGHPVRASFFMLSFGVGTLPLTSAVWMAVLPVQAGPRSAKGRRVLLLASVALVGVMLIGRSLTDGGPHTASTHPTVAPAHAH